MVSQQQKKSQDKYSSILETDSSMQKKTNCGCDHNNTNNSNDNSNPNNYTISTSQTIHPYIGRYHQAPQWMRYQQLTIGYRINFSSFKLIMKSIFMKHNQTTNVWTHLIGTSLLLLIGIITCSDLLKYFELSEHAHLTLKQNMNPIGSGCSFMQNITERCIDPNYLLAINDNNSNTLPYSLTEAENLIYSICSTHSNPYECYIQKSHQRKLKNWLQFYLGLPLDQIESMKLKLEQQIAPQVVHQMEDQLRYIEDYLHLYYGEQNASSNHKISQTKQQQNDNSSFLARWPLVFYLVCNSICLLCSVTYHLFYPLSQKAHSLCVCCDFAGISVLFGGSAIPCIYYGMYCYFQVGEIYLTGIICASILVFGLSFTDKFQNRKSSTFRVFIYFVFACFMVTPLFHMSINELIFNNYNDTYSFVSSLEWYILGLLFFAIGSFFYASQVPNRFSKSGKYDILGHSHHYWHVFVVMAIVSIYMGCLENYFTRKQSACGITTH